MGGGAFVAVGFGGGVAVGGRGVEVGGGGPTVGVLVAVFVGRGVFVGPGVLVGAGGGVLVGGGKVFTGTGPGAPLPHVILN